VRILISVIAPAVGCAPPDRAISSTRPTLFETSLGSLIPLIKPGKYSGRTSFSRRDSGFLKPAAAKNSEKQRGITAKQRTKTAND
jgi:hypothetical protein